MKKNDQQYNVSDLSRALLRQYLSQKGLKNTLQAFEKQDVNNKKKINKNILIQMISMKNLFLLNKNAIDPENSLLEILISYLNKKYRVKKNQFTTTSPNIFKQNLIDKQQEKKQFEYPKNKYRINSNKEIKTIQEIKNKTMNYQDEELKVIYKKLQKVQELKPVQAKISKQTANLQKKNDITKIAPAKQIKNDDKRQNENKVMKQKYKIAQQPVLSKPLVIQMQQQYEQPFQQEEIGQNINKLKKQTETYKNLSSQLKMIHEQSLEQTHKSIKNKNLNPSFSLNQKEAKKEATIVHDYKLQQKSSNENREKEKEQKNNLIKINSQQQNLNPQPIVHILQSKTQIQLNINNKKEQFKHNKQMGNCIDKLDNARQIKNQYLPQMVSKSRSQNMKILKKPETSTTNIEIVKPQQKLNEISVQIKNIKPSQVNNQVIIQDKQIFKTQQQISKTQKQLPQPIVNNSAPVMVAIGKKKKNKQQTNQQNYPTKFKFDQNFTHQIPKQITYEYKPYNFQPIVIDQKAKELHPWIVIQSKINYKQKGGGVNPLKKRVQKTINSKEAQKLRNIVFKSASPILPKAWHQGFILSPFEQTSYGLKQIQGGPCGIIAALQCYYLKHLLYCSKQSSINDQIVRQVSLVAAITNLLWKVKSTDKFILAFPIKNASKVDINNLKIMNVDVPDFQTAFAAIWSVRDEYIGNNNHGVTSLLFTSVLTKGFQKIQQEMDNKQNPLIGLHGHCTQQFVNMLLTGKASSNCFDGEKLIDDYKIKGISQKSQYGFLTIFQTLKYIEVGKNLKNPIFPVWVICKQFHYHVIFAPHYLISQQNKSQKFDIIYFDGLYNCGDRIRLTLQNLKADEEDNIKIKDLPLIQQVMMTKWGRKNANWNGSTKIL